MAGITSGPFIGITSLNAQTPTKWTLALSPFTMEAMQSEWRVR